jgi:hypothetical protein
MASSTSQNDQVRLLAKAWTDADFKTLLQDDPVAACEQENVDINQYISKTQQKGAPITVTIPPAPANVATMTRAQVELAAGTVLAQMGEMF